MSAAPTSRRMSTSSSLRLGFPAALGAYVIWGSLPLYIRAMSHVGAVELLAHRIIWSIPTAILLIAVAANWRLLGARLKDGARAAAVVKADGYGLGLADVAPLWCAGRHLGEGGDGGEMRRFVGLWPSAALVVCDALHRPLRHPLACNACRRGPVEAVPTPRNMFYHTSSQKQTYF